MKEIASLIMFVRKASAPASTLYILDSSTPERLYQPKPAPIADASLYEHRVAWPLTGIARRIYFSARRLCFLDIECPRDLAVVEVMIYRLPGILMGRTNNRGDIVCLKRQAAKGIRLVRWN
jgi:hypothetical protein